MKKIFFFALIVILMFACSKFKKKDKIKEANEKLTTLIQPVSLEKTPVSREILNTALDSAQELINATKKGIEKNDIKDVKDISSLKDNVYFVNDYKDIVKRLRSNADDKEVKVTLKINDIYLIGSVFKEELLFSKRILCPKGKEDFNIYYLNYKGTEKLIVKKRFSVMDKAGKAIIWLTITLL